MGISLWSLLAIQGNETSVVVYSDEKKTSYGFVVYLMREREIHTEIVSTLPHTPYTTEEEAQTAGDTLVLRIKEMDLNHQRAKLEGMMGLQVAKDVAEVVKRSREPNPNL
ncbi:MAG: hypothetical protein Q7S06_01675 [Nanoarchaeota archaeon]|nr:hypothetical protein [Nanoarchaeota archaeon]